MQKRIFRKLTNLELKQIRGGEKEEKKKIRKNFLDVYSIQDGEVVAVIKNTKKPSYGTSVIVRVKDKNNKSFFVRYAHLKSTNLKPTNKLKKNDVIGTMGKTGTELVHCHVSIYEDNPNITAEMEATEYSGIDNGRKINIFTYLKENNCVWPTNTQISGGHCQSYDFYLRTMWYPHEGGDFSGWRKIPRWEYGVPGDTPYNDDNGQHEKNRKLYYETRDEQANAFNKVLTEWDKLTVYNGKRAYSLDKALNRPKYKKIRNQIEILKKQISERVNYLRASESNKPKAIPLIYGDNIQSDLEMLKRELNSKEDMITEIKELAGKLQRVGSKTYAEKLRDKNNQIEKISNLEKRFKKVDAEYKKALGNDAYSEKIKDLYKNYRDAIGKALNGEKNNLEAMKKNLESYANGEKEVQVINNMGEIKPPNFKKIIAEEQAAAEKAKQEAEEKEKEANHTSEDNDSDSNNETPEPWSGNNNNTNNKHGTSGNSGNHQDNNSQGGNTGNSNGNIGNGGTQKPKPGSGSTTPNNPGNGGGTGGNNGTTPKPDDPPSGGGGGKTPKPFDPGIHMFSLGPTIPQYPGLGEYYIDRIRSNPLSAGTKPIGYYTEQRNNTPSLQNTVNIGFAGSTSNDISIKEDEGLSTGNEWV